MVEKYFRGNLKSLSWLLQSKNNSAFNLKAILKDITENSASLIDFIFLGTCIFKI